MTLAYHLVESPARVKAALAYANDLDFPPRALIKPSEPVLIVQRGASGARETTLVLWGLIPAWVKDPREFGALFTARAETALEKPSFKGAMRHRRCLVPATGFHVWRGSGRRREALDVRPVGGGILALAGLSEHWLGADGSEIDTMALLTVPTSAPEWSGIERLPAVIAPSDMAHWLDVRGRAPREVQGLLVPPQPEFFLMTATTWATPRAGD